MDASERKFDDVAEFRYYHERHIGRLVKVIDDEKRKYRFRSWPGLWPVRYFEVDGEAIIRWHDDDK